MASHVSEMSASPLLENSSSLRVTSCLCAPQSVPLAVMEPHSPLLSALQRVSHSAVAGRTFFWVGWRGVCYTTRVLLTIVSSVGGKCVCGVCVCVVGEGGQGPEQVVGLYLELNTTFLYAL